MSVLAARGFEAAGIASGIKPGGALDLALVATTSRRPVPAAGVFTMNLAAAAPVQISRRHLAAGHAAAVVLNSGNANACTGDDGRAVAERTCAAAAHELGCRPDDVLVCSTGLIGIPLPLDPITSSMKALAASLGGDPASADTAAHAILTTDTVSKTAVARFLVRHRTEATVGGMAKGAAMLSPAMATMLAVLTTDAAVEPAALHAALERAVEVSFNQLSVDGCRSTNDTVLVLASGEAGDEPIGFGGAGFHGLTDALTAVCQSLAEQMAADAEGATKQVRVHVRGARSREDARRAARAVADSQLVKCSLYGEDPYWGRVLSELGASGAQFDAEGVSIAYNGVVVCIDGVAAPHDRDAIASAMAQRSIEITCDLAAGRGDAVMLTTDLTHGYIDENMRTS